MLNGEKRRVYLKAKMWGGREEGNVYLNQPVTLCPLQQKPKSSSNFVNTILSLKNKTKKLNSKEQNIKK